MAAPPPGSEENFRQAGRSLRGKILHTRTSGQLGVTHPSAPPQPSATIPSKYETVLYAQPKERTGFGSQASRFAAEAVNDNPGPGTYASGIGSNLLRDAPSIGKRGYGNGFASRTKRSGFVGAPGARGIPGPGQVSAAAFPSPKACAPRSARPPADVSFVAHARSPLPPLCASQQYNVNSYRATGSDVRAISRPFQKPKGGRALRPDGAGADNAQTPGPGAYDLTRHTDPLGGALSPGHAGHRSVFASKAPRFVNALSSFETRPGPGSYETATESSLSTRVSATMPSAAFRSGLSRTAARNAGARAPPIEEVLGVPRPVLGGHGAAMHAHSGRSVPGPGSYTPVPVEQAFARSGAVGPSPAFRTGLTVCSAALGCFPCTCSEAARPPACIQCPPQSSCSVPSAELAAHFAASARCARWLYWAHALSFLSTPPVLCLPPPPSPASPAPRLAMPGTQDRFGKPLERLSRATQPAELPGPGAYDLLTGPDRTGSRTFGKGKEDSAPVSSAAFMSATRREALAGGARAAAC